MLFHPLFAVAWAPCYSTRRKCGRRTRRDGGGQRSPPGTLAKGVDVGGGVRRRVDRCPATIRPNRDTVVAVVADRWGRKCPGRRGRPKMRAPPGVLYTTCGSRHSRPPRRLPNTSYVRILLQCAYVRDLPRALLRLLRTRGAVGGVCPPGRARSSGPAAAFAQTRGVDDSFGGALRTCGGTPPSGPAPHVGRGVDWGVEYVCTGRSTPRTPRIPQK